MATTTRAGSAERWGPLWSARAGDWAKVEEQQIQTYDSVIRRVGIAPGQRVLEVGCGSGVFLRAAADHGARVDGIDASDSLLELARARVPQADLRLGDMQFLPYENDSFDLVAGFNNEFSDEQDLTDALLSARRAAIVDALAQYREPDGSYRLENEWHCLVTRAA